MQIVFELWNAKPAFLDAPATVREEIIGGVRGGIEQMAGMGIRTLGWGRVAPSSDHPSGYDWFAVWEIPSPQLVDAFFSGVAASGWYDWFEQVNVSGELESVDVVLQAHLALTAEAKR